MMDEPSWVVLKFGGTSVSTLERWQTIVSVIEERLSGGERPWVVCSALSGVSNLLEEGLQQAAAGDHQEVLDEVRERHRRLADSLGVEFDSLESDLGQLERTLLGISLTGEVSPRLHARVMAYGELLSTKLGAEFVQKMGLAAQWVDARECLVSDELNEANDARLFLSATCSFAPDNTLQSGFSAPGHVIITQGFIARDSRGQTVLLGRGGSDTSAAYFAAKLEAKRIEIWTDVPGMYTANPRDVDSARMLRQLDYEEAQELATTGAKVLHPRCIDPLRRAGISLHIRCT